MDDRMTTETKLFMDNVLKQINPNDLIKLPTASIRHARFDAVKKLIQSLKFDNLHEPKVRGK
jgi:hypothetical protein